MTGSRWVRCLSCDGVGVGCERCQGKGGFRVKVGSGSGFSIEVLTDDGLDPRIDCEQPCRRGHRRDGA